MQCNDKLLKLEGSVENFLKRIDRQLLDIESKTEHEWVIHSSEVELSTRRFAAEFRWNEAKYPQNYPMAKLLELLEGKLTAIEGEMRGRINSFNETKAQLAQATQKEYAAPRRGNYNIKDLAEVLVEPSVSRSDFLATKFIQTVIAVVPLSAIDEFTAKYELLAECVVPHSARRLRVPEKDGLSLW